MLTISRRVTILLAVVILLAATAAIAGGCSGPDGYKAFVAAADVAANETIGPRYAVYVSNDPALSVEQKTTYLNELQAFRDAVAAAVQDQSPAPGP